MRISLRTYLSQLVHYVLVLISHLRILSASRTKLEDVLNRNSIRCFLIYFSLTDFPDNSILPVLSLISPIVALASEIDPQIFDLILVDQDEEALDFPFSAILRIFVQWQRTPPQNIKYIRKIFPKTYLIGRGFPIRLNPDIRYAM